MRWPAAPVIALSVALVSGQPVTARTYPTPPLTMMRLIAALDKAEPLSLEALQRVVGQTWYCRDSSALCPVILQFEDGTRVTLNFRVTKYASTLGLSAPDTCLPVADIDREFGAGTALNAGCTEGIPCWSINHARPWGTLSLPAPDYPAVNCLHAITMIARL